MSLSTIVVFYIIIGIVTLITIIFSIVNWITLNKLNLEINRMQIAIGKKIKQLNFEKKDTIETTQRQNVDPMAHQPTSNTFVHNQDNQPHIEIVRNVRQEFSPDNVHDGPDNSQQGEQPSQQISASMKTMNNEECPGNNKENDRESEEILDIVNQSHPGEHGEFGNDEHFTVALYSDYTKDADFKKLWNELNRALVSTSIFTVFIDLKRILFLYDKEIEYLETISQTIKSHKKSLFFINCNAELRQIIQKNDTLKQLIKVVQNSQ